MHCGTISFCEEANLQKLDRPIVAYTNPVRSSAVGISTGQHGSSRAAFFSFSGYNWLTFCKISDCLESWTLAVLLRMRTEARSSRHVTLRHNANAALTYARMCDHGLRAGGGLVTHSIPHFHIWEVITAKISKWIGRGDFVTWWWYL